MQLEIRKLRQANARSVVLLNEALKELSDLIEDEPIMTETPLEAEAVMQSVLKNIRDAIRHLKSALHPREAPEALPGKPTH